MITDPPPPPPPPPFIALLRSPASPGAAASALSALSVDEEANTGGSAPAHASRSAHATGPSNSDAAGSTSSAASGDVAPREPSVATFEDSVEAGAGAGPGPGPGPGSAHFARVRSLQECCCRVISRHLSVHNCLELLAVTCGTGRAEAPVLAEVGEAALRYAAHSFETLQSLRSEAELRAALPEGMYDALAAAAAERAAAVAERRALLGRVREREAPPRGAAQPLEGPSVAGHSVCYPPEALQPGLVWPPEVEGGRREEWLAEADFGRLFGGLSWAQYCAQPGWKRERLKRAAGLF